ncbi:hypothetical protein BC941DRAFT_427258, partial [Chlamydoabsidia padenii]
MDKLFTIFNKKKDNRRSHQFIKRHTINTASLYTTNDKILKRNMTISGHFATQTRTKTTSTTWEKEPDSFGLGAVVEKEIDCSSLESNRNPTRQVTFNGEHELVKGTSPFIGLSHAQENSDAWNLYNEPNQFTDSTPTFVAPTQPASSMPFVSTTSHQPSFHNNVNNTTTILYMPPQLSHQLDWFDLNSTSSNQYQFTPSYSVTPTTTTNGNRNLYNHSRSRSLPFAASHGSSLLLTQEFIPTHHTVKSTTNPFKQQQQQIINPFDDHANEVVATNQKPNHARMPAPPVPPQSTKPSFPRYGHHPISRSQSHRYTNPFL